MSIERIDLPAVSERQEQHEEVVQPKHLYTMDVGEDGVIRLDEVDLPLVKGDIFWEILVFLNERGTVNSHNLRTFILEREVWKRSYANPTSSYLNGIQRIVDKSQGKKSPKLIDTTGSRSKALHSLNIIGNENITPDINKTQQEMGRGRKSKGLVLEEKVSQKKPSKKPVNSLTRRTEIKKVGKKRITGTIPSRLLPDMPMKVDLSNTKSVPPTPPSPIKEVLPSLRGVSVLHSGYYEDFSQMLESMPPTDRAATKALISAWQNQKAISESDWISEINKVRRQGPFKTVHHTEAVADALNKYYGLNILRDNKNGTIYYYLRI